ncbi:peptidoglycan-binding domain-containing protein [Loktanella sp. D2R18]|uniref:peptidoglycan-binding domain-containing protein n=2 Tax=Rhodobacterales TaxID=204455 RepID=UPI003857B0E7
MASESIAQNRPANAPDTGARVQCHGSNQSCVKSRTSIIEIQTQLRQHCKGLPANFADGVWGNQTQNTLVRFQRAYGLVPDGIYGPASAQALAGSPNGRC